MYHRKLSKYDARIHNIANNVYLGTNSSIKEKLFINDDVVIGLNSGVVNNITKPGVYVGTPAKLKN